MIFSFSSKKKQYYHYSWEVWRQSWNFFCYAWERGSFLFECKMYSRVHLKKYFFALPSAKIVVKIFYRKSAWEKYFPKEKVLYIPAAMMWKIQGSLCSPTVLRLQHIKVPYSKVRVGVKVKRLVDPLVRINRSLTVLASAELLKVHLKFQRYHCCCDKSFNFFSSCFFTDLKDTSGGLASTLHAMCAVSILATP